MRHLYFNWVRLFALAGVALVGVASCGDDGGGTALAPELFGTWDLESIEADAMSADCPGEIELSDTEAVSCGTEATTFNADGTFFEIETTDELGAPYDWRSEGTWATQGNTLSLTYRQEGPDAGNLQPINPPESQSGTWSVAGDTLTISGTSPFPPFGSVTGTLQKQ